MNSLSTALVTAALASASLLGQTDPVDLVLTDITAQAGIDWVQTDNFSWMGGGCALLDYDQDGWLDVLTAGGFTTPALFRNRRDGTFERVTPPSLPAGSPVFFAIPPGTPIGIGLYTTCVTVADIDNDGDPDVFFGRWGENRLYRNDGGGTFTDVTTPALAGRTDAYTTSAAFGDYDRDGALDLFVGNYIRQFFFPTHTPEPNQLLRGHGDGTFVEVTDSILAGAGTALASTWTDFDADGDVDLMCGNDFGATIEPNQVYRNDSTGTPSSGPMLPFSEQSAALGLDLTIFCMGIAVGDFDRDRDFDYYFTNLGRNVLMRNDGTTFVDVTDATGTGVTHDPLTFPQLLATSWGAGFHDFDSDGWLDLYVSNGHVPSVLGNGDATPNSLLRGGASSVFAENPGELHRGIGRGVAFGDIDNDGDVDVLQANVHESPRLLRNDTPRTTDTGEANHWLALDLRGRTSNRDAIGARADVFVDDFVACREVRRNDSFQSSSDPRLAFGLGTATAAHTIEIQWPSGITQELHDIAVDRRLSVLEPTVTVSDATLDTIDFAPFGTVLVFQAQLTNHSGITNEAAFVPQVRSRSATNTAGLATPAWTGAIRGTVLAPGEQRAIYDLQLLPPGASLPTGGGTLRHVWITADRALAIDEATVRIAPD